MLNAVIFEDDSSKRDVLSVRSNKDIGSFLRTFRGIEVELLYLFLHSIHAHVFFMMVLFCVQAVVIASALDLSKPALGLSTLQHIQ